MHTLTLTRMCAHVHERSQECSAVTPRSLLCLPTGQELDVKVVSVDIPRCRVALSLKQMQRDPLQTTMDSIQWRETTQMVPEVQQIVQMLELTAGIQSVTVGRQAEETHTVSQVRLGLAGGLVPGSSIPTVLEVCGDGCTVFCVALLAVLWVFCVVLSGTLLCSMQL